MGNAVTPTMVESTDPMDFYMVKMGDGYLSAERDGKLTLWETEGMFCDPQEALDALAQWGGRLEIATVRIRAASDSEIATLRSDGGSED